MTSTKTDPKRTRESSTGGGSGAGYRGTLPPRDDRLARPWLIIVAVVFVAIFVLSFLGIPSRLIPEPTPVPLPTSPPVTDSPTPAASPSPTLEDSPDGSPSPSPSPSPAAS